MNAIEVTLSEQFQRLAQAFSQVAPLQARVTRLDIPLPYARRILPGATFDMRALLQLHARGIAQAVQSTNAPKPRAHTVLAELFLMQHSCHWFCARAPRGPGSPCWCAIKPLMSRCWRPCRQPRATPPRAGGV
jgi:hypothetical protein